MKTVLKFVLLLILLLLLKGDTARPSDCEADGHRNEHIAASTSASWASRPCTH